jgi:CHAT domain-containing protein/tetratricopeptide (TPR) repeat protein
MTLQKFTLLFIVLIIFAFFVRYTTNQPEQKPTPAGTKSFASKNIDSLINQIKSSGWNNKILNQYSRYLNNSQIDFNRELEKLKSLSYSFERSFLISLVFKKQNNYEAMYDSLYSQLESNKTINYLPYYEEIVYSASAINLLTALESKAPSLKRRNSFYADYLISLISFSLGEYENSLSSIKNWFKKDSTNFSLVYHVSYIYRNLGNYDRALKILAGYQKDERKIDEWELAKIYPAEGSLYFYSGNYSEAEKLYLKGLNAAQKIGDVEDESKTLVNLAIISDVNGYTDKARAGFFDAAEMAKKINSIDAEALAYSELGVSYSFTNELIKAKKYYELSYSFYKKIGNHLRLSLLSNNLGKIYMTMFDYESALNCYQKGVEFAGENKHAMAVNLIGLADVYTNLSNYSKAVQLYREAKDISSEIKEVSLEAQIYLGLGDLNFHLDRYNDALNYFERSYKLNNQTDEYLSVQIFNKIGVVYDQLDSVDKAAGYFKNAAELSKKNNDSYSEALSCINLASLYSERNNFEKAKKALKTTKDILNKNDFKYLTAQSYLIDGEILKGENMFQDAENALKKADELGSEIKEFNTRIQANYMLAKLFEEKNLNETAESYYESAISLIEDVSRPLFENEQIQISYYLSKNDIYNSFAEFYLKQKKYVKAFELTDRSRSRNTMNNLNNLKLEGFVRNDSLLKKIYDYEWILHSNIYNKKETDDTKTQLSLLKEKLIKMNPGIKKYLNMDRNLSLPEIQKNLNEGENLLSIYTAKNKTYLFLIGGQSFYPFEVDINVDTLRKMISEISPYLNSSTGTNSFYNQDLFSFNSRAAYDLYKKLLKPVFEKIKPGEKVIISASPELLTLPFEFFVTKYNESESSYNYKNKKFLVMDYDISYVPSAAIFIQQKNNNLSNDEKVLLVGNPLINNKIEGYAERRGLLDESGSMPRNIPLLPLKYSSEEVSEIGNIVNADKILTDKNATETNFKNNAGQNGIIHVSTHSFLFNKQPVIFFSNYYDPDNDGFLEEGEIVQLKLNSDLVVLSSCNSGLGIIDESEGVLGMTKAFFEAGAKSVIVSLWAVNDKYTAKFMTLFYQNLSNGLDKSGALREAKIEFIKKYSPNPYYWAAFILSGNVSRLNIKTKFNTAPVVIAILLIILTPTLLIYLKKYKSK